MLVVCGSKTVVGVPALVRQGEQSKRGAEGIGVRAVAFGVWLLGACDATEGVTVPGRLEWLG